MVNLARLLQMALTLEPWKAFGEEALLLDAWPITLGVAGLGLVVAGVAGRFVWLAWRDRGR